MVIAEKEKSSRTGSADDPIAAAVFLQVADSAIYKFGASDERLWQLRANNLVMFRAIQFLAASGAKTLDFGRTALDSPGLRRFKLSWGTEEKVIHYFRFDLESDGWLQGQTRPSGVSIHQAIFRHLPLSLNRFAGTMIYPHID